MQRVRRDARRAQPRDLSRAGGVNPALRADLWRAMHYVNCERCALQQTARA